MIFSFHQSIKMYYTGGDDDLRDPLFLLPLADPEVLTGGATGLEDDDDLEESPLPAPPARSQGWNPASPPPPRAPNPAIKGSPAAPNPADKTALRAPGCQGGQTSSSIPSLWRKPVGAFFFLLSKDFSMSFSRAEREAEEAEADGPELSLVSEPEGGIGWSSGMSTPPTEILTAFLFSISISSLLSSSSFLIGRLPVDSGVLEPELVEWCFRILTFLSERGGLEGEEGVPREEVGLSALSGFVSTLVLRLTPWPTGSPSSSEQSHEEFSEEEETDEDQTFAFVELEGPSPLSFARVIHFSTAERVLVVEEVTLLRGSIPVVKTRDPLTFRNEVEGRLSPESGDVMSLWCLWTGSWVGNFISKDLSIRLWRAERDALEAAGPPFASFSGDLRSVLTSLLMWFFFPFSSFTSVSWSISSSSSFFTCGLSRSLFGLMSPSSLSRPLTNEVFLHSDLMCVRRFLASTFTPHSSHLTNWVDNDNGVVREEVDEGLDIPFLRSSLEDVAPTTLAVRLLEMEGPELVGPEVDSILSSSRSFLTGKLFFLFSLVCLRLPFPPSVIVLNMCSL